MNIEAVNGDLHGCIGCNKANTRHPSCISRPKRKLEEEGATAPWDGDKGDRATLNVWAANLVATFHNQRNGSR